MRFLSILIIGLIIAGCNREENNERKALSHCADIKYIKFINSNPQFIVDLNKKVEFIEAVQEREVAVQKWMAKTRCYKFRKRIL